MIIKERGDLDYFLWAKNPREINDINSYKG